MTAPTAPVRPQRPPVPLPLLAALGGAGLVAVLLVMSLVGRGGPAMSGPASVSISPSGLDVARLSPVVVSFPSPPEERDGARLVGLWPAVEGSYTWTDDRTLLFQPEFPGLLRGSTYEVRVDGAAAALPQDVAQSFTVEGKLAVAYAIPGDGDEEVPAEAQILVQFSRSVAPLTVLTAQDNAPPVEFDPPLPGSGEWLNTSIYRFTPDRLEPSTTYTARVRAGLTAAADGVLEQDYTWTFTSFGPALAAADPADRTEFVGRQRPVVLTFNQPMDRASVQAGTSLLAGGASVSAEPSWSSDGRVLTLTPREPLEVDTSYTVVLASGLRGEARGETAAERRIEFRTAAHPRVLSTDPADGATNAQRWGITVQFNNPMDIESLEERVSVSGITAEEMELYSWDDRSIQISAMLQPSTTYTVTIGGGATDREGQALPATSFSFTTGALDPAVRFAVPGQLATYSASDEPVLFFHATNTAEATFRLWQLTEADAQQILRENQVPWTGDAAWRPRYAPVREWTLELGAERDLVRLGSTSLGDGGPLPPGDYFVAAGSAPDASLMFSVVDTALVTKLAHDELLVWALDYATGEPLANLPVRASGPGASPNTVRTNAEGLASFSVLHAADAVDIDRSYVVRVDADGRRGVASTRWQAGAEPWALGLPIEWMPGRFAGHVYTDRPIYRPGETVRYKGVVRSDNDANYQVPREATGLSLLVTDTQGNELRRADLVLNQHGTFAADLQLATEAPTGYYNIAVVQRRGEWDWWVAGSSFTVAEFRRPEFQVEAATPRVDYVDGETIEIDVEATFFFGGALAGAPVEWSALASPSAPRFSDYPGYSFSDFDFWVRSEVLEPMRARGQATTGADGQVRIEVPAALRGGEGTQDFQVSASVSDENQQVVASSTTVTVHPAALYAGIRPTEYLATSGSPATLEVVTVDLDGRPVAARPVTVEVYERRWVTTKEETPAGRRYRSEPVDTLVETLTTTTNAAGEGTVSFTAARPGTLRFVSRVSDDAGRTARAAAFLWVTGGEFASWQVRNDDVIELIADRDSYRVGDVAEVLVPAPFEGAVGLVTIERGRIISRETRVFDTTSDVLSIPITAAHVPNVYVSVVLYRPPTEEDPLPRYKIGYVALPVSTESRELVVTVSPDTEQARPGEQVRYDVFVTDREGRPQQAELSVAVVDKAVLSLADQVGPDGLRAFWYERGLGVQTASSLAVSIDRTNDVITEPELGGKGGGGDEPRLREDFQNTAYWQAQLETGPDGRASVEVPMPDNLTTWHTLVRAVSGDTMVGEGTNDLVSTQPLLLRPALPRFLRAGDEVTLRLLVRNATSETTDVSVTLEAAGVSLREGTQRTGRIAPQSSITLEWPASAATAGEARFRFVAAGSNGLADAVELALPVYLDVTPETMATGGTVTVSPATEAIYLPPFALTANGSLEILVQASIVGGLAEELRELRHEPFESNARTASRIIATIGTARAEGRTAVPEVSADVTTLLARRLNDGGWGWCSSGCPSHPQVTAWVVLALADARDTGHQVNAGVLGQASMLLRGQAGRFSDVERPAHPDTQAFLLYAAARSGDASATSALRALAVNDRARLGDSGRAYVVLGLMQGGDAADAPEVRALLNDLTASTVASANGNHWEDEPRAGTLLSSVRTTSLVLRALVAAEPRHALMEQSARWLVSARSARTWQTDIERAEAIASLGRYAELTGERAGDFDYAAMLNEREVLAGHFTPSDEEARNSAIVPLQDVPLGQVSRLTLSRDTARPGRLYYGVNLRYQTPARDVEALNRGFGISREYTLLGEPDRPIEGARLGDVVRVRLTVIAPADRHFVSIEDFLPAGLEPIDPQLRIVPADLREQLERERRDAAVGAGGDDGYYAPWFRWYWSPWEQVSTRDDRVTLAATTLPRGVHEYIYYLRATSPGDFYVAPAHAEETYSPEVFGRGDSTRFTVQ